MPCPGWHRQLTLTVLWLWLWLSSTPAAARQEDTFHESLQIRPLPDGKVLSHFEFTTSAFDNAWEGSNLVDDSISTYQTTLLPRSLASIIRTYDVEEVHLTLTSGRWDFSRWKNPIGHGAPSGGEIYAWLSAFEGDDGGAVKQRWTGLTNSLGGLFCSSLNNLDEKMTVSPLSTFFPSTSSSSNSPFFHALLPLERPCTENLTPFISQLPCRSSAGLAELLNPYKLFDANWQKLAIHVVRDMDSGKLEIKLEMEVVQDPVRMTSAAGSQLRRDWTFDSLFGRPIRKACPVAESSLIIVDLSNEDEDAGHSLEPKASWEQLPPDNAAIFDVEKLPKPINLNMRWPVMQREGFEYPMSYEAAPLIVERIKTGYGLERNQLGIQLKNNGDVPASVTWLEEWPAWIKVYMHTLRVTVNGEEVSHDTILDKMDYRQAQSRGQPTVIEAGLSIPAKSTIRIVLDVDKAYLWYTDYPPDTHRGFDVPSGVILVHGHGLEPERRLYTTTVLLDMPAPDFSMPYNVIIMTCTVIALFFGSVFNLLTRTWLIIDMRDTKPESVETAKKVEQSQPASTVSPDD